MMMAECRLEVNSGGFDTFWTEILKLNLPLPSAQTYLYFSFLLKLQYLFCKPKNLNAELLKSMSYVC